MMSASQERIDQLLEFIRKNNLEPPLPRVEANAPSLFSLKVAHRLCYCTSSVANGGIECGWPNAMYNPKSDLHLDSVTQRHLIVNRTYTPLQGELVASHLALENIFSQPLYFKVELYETNRTRTFTKCVTTTQGTNNLRIQRCGKHLVGIVVCDPEKHLVRLLKSKWSMPLQIVPTSGCVQHDERLFVVRLLACTESGDLLTDSTLNVETQPFRNVSNYHISRAMKRVSNVHLQLPRTQIRGSSSQMQAWGQHDDDLSSISTCSQATVYKRKRD